MYRSLESGSHNEEIKIDLVSIEKGLEEGSIIEIFPTEIDLKTGQRLRYFADHRSLENRFIKLFNGGVEEAENELANVQKISKANKHLSIVTPLSEYKKDGIIAVCYPFIDGVNLQLCFEQLKGTSELTQIAKEAIRQSSTLSVNSETIGLKDYVAAPKFLMGYPFSLDDFDGQIFSEINKAYLPFWILRRNICNAFPGYSLDRHSRNVLVGKDNTLHHIDFEVATKDSPFFDFVKIIRNGPDSTFSLSKAIWNDAIKYPKEFCYQLNPFTENEERELVEFFMHNRFPSYDGDTESFANVYEIVAAHTHLFYISKYLRRYSVAPSETKPIAEARLHYHIIGYLALADKLFQVNNLHGDLLKGVSNSVSVEQTLKLNSLVLELANNFIDQNAK